MTARTYDRLGLRVWDAADVESKISAWGVVTGVGAGRRLREVGLTRAEAEGLARRWIDATLVRLVEGVDQ